MTEPNPTACLLIIGNEVLSGRTRDANLQFLATRLGEIGIPLREARVIPDVPEEIIAAVNATRKKYDHVFTTGGIGPTHDDITGECIAAAFGVPWEPHAETVAMMGAYFAARGTEFNAARMRMATLPRGATPIVNAVSIAPGYTIENVHVMAGVPRIMQSMFEALAPSLKGGRPILSQTVHARGIFEGQIAAPLATVQDHFPALDIGSYPFQNADVPGSGGVALVAKGIDAEAVSAAAAEIAAMLRDLGAVPIEGEPA